MTREYTKTKAVILRKRGHSYNYISDKLNVSKSTLNYWLPSIPYQPNVETIKRIGKARAASGLANHRKKLQSLLEAKIQAKFDIGRLSKRDLFMLGIGLYIGEGGKKQTTLRIINSDPRIIKLAVHWLEKICNLKKSNFTLAIHLYPDNNIFRSLKFWSKTTGIPINQFGKTQVDKREDKKLFKMGTLPHGTAHLTVRSNGEKKYGVNLTRRVLAWIDEVYRTFK